jgi:hypothetical protein
MATKAAVKSCGKRCVMPISQTRDRSPPPKIPRPVPHLATKTATKTAGRKGNPTDAFPVGYDLHIQINDPNNYTLLGDASTNFILHTGRYTEEEWKILKSWTRLNAEHTMGKYIFISERDIDLLSDEHDIQFRRSKGWPITYRTLRSHVNMAVRLGLLKIDSLERVLWNEKKDELIALVRKSPFICYQDKTLKYKILKITCEK